MLATLRPFKQSFHRRLSYKAGIHTKMATNLPKLADVEQLSTNIIRVMGGNPSKFTLQGSNTYILGSGPSRILLDTGQGFPAWRNNLSSALEKYSCSISITLLSHWHHDHLGGVSDLHTLCPDSTLHKNEPSLNPEGLLDASTVQGISDGDKFRTNEGFEVTALHTPGHTTDHMCFIVTQSNDQSEVGSIFTVDNVLGHGTAVFEDLAVYLSTLGLMHSTVSANPSPVKAYPGHGAVIDDAAAKIQEYIDHRKMREEEVLNVLRYGTTTQPLEGVGSGDVAAGKEWSSMEIVKVIYRQYPENLWLPAEGGVKMVLGKLRQEGKVSFDQEREKWRINGRATL